MLGGEACALTRQLAQPLGMNAVGTGGIEADCAQAGQLLDEALERRCPGAPGGWRAQASMLIAVSCLGRKQRLQRFGLLPGSGRR